MPIIDPQKRPESAWIGASLTWTAGFVDAVGFLTLFHIYSANMSGNSVAIAIDSSQNNWGAAMSHAWPVIFFLPGLFTGAAVVRALQVAGAKAPLAPAMLIESALLVLFPFLGQRFQLASGDKYYFSGLFISSVGLLAFSMGFQNAALRQFGGLKNVHTYVTGTLLAMAQGFTEFIFWFLRRFRPSSTRLRRIRRYASRQPSLREGAFAGLLWIFYMLGGVMGAFGHSCWKTNCILAPALVLIVIAIISFIRPPPPLSAPA